MEKAKSIEFAMDTYKKQCQKEGIEPKKISIDRSNITEKNLKNTGAYRYIIKFNSIEGKPVAMYLISEDKKNGIKIKRKYTKEYPSEKKVRVIELARQAYIEMCSKANIIAKEISPEKSSVNEKKLESLYIGPVRLRDNKGKTVAIYRILWHNEWEPTIERVYTSRNIAEIASIILEAKQLWEKRVAEYIETKGHQGTFVMGAGIAALYLGRGEKNPRVIHILEPPDYKGIPIYQSLIWEKSLEEVLGFLHSRGVDCYYNSGHMD